MFKIGLFCPTASRKNCLNQIYAFNLANKDDNLELHTNLIIRTNGNIKYYSWLEDSDYKTLLGNMNLMLNVFLAESMCYTFLESMIIGIPALCSPCIADNFELSKELRDKLVVINCDSCEEISNKILNIINMDTKSYEQLCQECKKQVLEIVDSNNDKLKQIFSC